MWKPVGCEEGGKKVTYTRIQGEESIVVGVGDAVSCGNWGYLLLR